MNKRVLSFTILMILLLALMPVLAACGGKDAAKTMSSDAASTSAPTASTVADITDVVPSAPDDEGVQTMTTDGTNAALKVLSTVAYVFEGAEGVTIYGAAEYENTGDCPITVENAVFEFGIDGVAEKVEFVPVFAENTIILPGEKAFVAQWLPRAELTTDAKVTLNTAELTAKNSDDAGIRLTVGDVYLADNYPGFTTISGALTLEKSKPCAMNVIYFGFYDEDSNFLGAWYFTKNASFEAGDKKSFVAHMRELPVDGLAERCALTEAIGFGFN